VKILIFYQYFGTPAGSWSTRMYELSRRWVKAGHKVTVVTAPYEKSDIKPDGFISRTRLEGIELIIINSGDSNRDTFLKRAFNALRFSIVSCKMALSEPCDVVLASSGPITVGIPALAAKWFRRKKMVFEIRDLWPQGAIELGKIKSGWMKSTALWFEKLCYHNSSIVVACSPGMEACVKERFPLVKTMVVSNASDPSLFKAPGKDIFRLPDQFIGKNIFLYAGSLGLMDHGSLILRSMKLIDDSSIQMVIVGEGADRKMLEQEALDLELKNVHFLGLKPKTELVQWFAVARASLVLFKNYPVLQTSSPNKLFDAFAAGIPVIHNTTGWIKEVVDREQCGVSIGPDDHNALAKAMIRITEDNSYRNLLAENSARLGQTVFNRDRLSQKYLDALMML